MGRAPRAPATIGDGVAVRTSTLPGAGNGLFAARPFARGELVTEVRLRAPRRAPPPAARRGGGGPPAQSRRRAQSGAAGRAARGPAPPETPPAAPHAPPLPSTWAR
jgi:hypothetical protein